MCIEVLLSYAQGDYDILRETNAKGETPLDIADALGDTSLVVRSGRAARGGARACPERGVDMQRIMAVWERFFENAAVACVGGRDTTRAPGVPSRKQHGQLGAGLHEITAKTLELGGWVTPGDQPAMDRKTAKEDDAVTTARENGARTGAEIAIRSGDEEKGWSDGEADISSLAVGERDRQLLRLLRGTPAVESAHTCTWDAVPIDPVGDHHEVEPFGGTTRQQPTPQQPTTKEELHVQLDSEAPALSSDDVDLHLFQTPRGESSDTEVVWLSASHQGDIRSASEPPADTESSPVSATAAGTLPQNHHTWVACWDAASESIYYWDSETGESTWDAPASTDGIHELQSWVWDPQREAFFTIDEGGTSYWLADSTVEGRTAIGDVISVDTAAPLVQVANYGRTNSVSTSSTTRPSWQGFGLTVGAVEGSPSTEAVIFPRNLDAISAEEAEEEIAVGNTRLEAKTERQEQSLRLSPYSLAEAGYQSVGQLPDCLINGYNYPGEESSRGMHTAREDDGQEQYKVELTARVEHTLSVNTAASSAINSECAGEEDKSDGGEFFDSRTCEDHGQLSAWVLWCTAPSHQDGGEPPYFVNEETGTSSWVLPPEAVATSGGWLRAWSEEHQAWFYSNQWTGIVTWELRDLEAEGVLDSSARVES